MPYRDCSLLYPMDIFVELFRTTSNFYGYTWNSSGLNDIDLVISGFLQSHNRQLIRHSANMVGGQKHLIYYVGYLSMRHGNISEHFIFHLF